MSTSSRGGHLPAAEGFSGLHLIQRAYCAGRQAKRRGKKEKRKKKKKKRNQEAHLVVRWSKVPWRRQSWRLVGWCSTGARRREAWSCIFSSPLIICGGPGRFAARRALGGGGCAGPRPQTSRALTGRARVGGGVPVLQRLRHDALMAKALSVTDRAAGALHPSPKKEKKKGDDACGSGGLRRNGSRSPTGHLSDAWCVLAAAAGSRLQVSCEGAGLHWRCGLRPLGLV